MAQVISIMSADGQTATEYRYEVRNHEKYGKYIDARQFGTDTSGKTDSLDAIQAALQAANQEKAAVYLNGDLYVSDQVVIDQSVGGVTGIFGDGMGKTTVRFDKEQTGSFNPNSNHDDIREFAGILVDGVSNTTIAGLAVEYTRSSDFYVKGQSYFGKVSGILVNDADNTLVSGVEVSGVNRAGVIFTSTAALTEDARSGRSSYKARAAQGEIDETDSLLPLGENNRLENSYLHHNRVAGAMVAYQQDFVADNNILSWNGHPADGGTGYGITAMAGSYNYGVTFSNNNTDHNYRKGLDVHDGTDIVITGNTSNGDRLYGIAVYNRQFAMDNVKITDNTIIQDASFRLSADDNPGLSYHGYSGIQLQTNTQHRDLRTEKGAAYEISGNTISGLTVYQDAMQTYGIEFRNHEHSIDYTLDITGNNISGSSSRYLIAAINDTSLDGKEGAGSGTVNISGNSAKIDQIVAGTVPVYVEEKGTSSILRGSVTVSQNDIAVAKSNGVVEGIQLIGNAETYTVTDNKLDLRGSLNKSVISVLGNSTAEDISATISDNVLTSDRKTELYSEWIQAKNASYVAIDNKHNHQTVATASNLLGSNLESFEKAKVAADAKDSDLTTVFDMEKNGFSVESLFTRYETAKVQAVQAYQYGNADDTFTADTNENSGIL